MIAIALLLVLVHAAMHFYYGALLIAYAYAMMRPMHGWLLAAAWCYDGHDCMYHVYKYTVVDIYYISVIHIYMDRDQYIHIIIL